MTEKNVCERENKTGLKTASQHRCLGVVTRCAAFLLKFYVHELT